MRRGALVAAVIAALAAGLTACGDDGESGSGATLRFFIFNEPGGGPQKAAAECSKQSDGAYTIKFEYLPSRADQQREQLVRRLGAEDDTIDLVGMDIIWTGEFANAGWLEPVPDDRRAALTANVFESVLKTAQFEDRLYNVPIWSNTELLWYRKDRVSQAPETWDELIEQAEKIGPKEGRIQVQANRYEGLVVWANAMIESAGTSFLSGPQEVKLERKATERALAIMGKVAGGPQASPDVDTSNEDTGRLGFEAGDSAFMINYPFVFPSAKDNAPDIFKQMGAAKYPGIEKGTASKPPLGGINIGVSKFSKHKAAAFDAIECLIKPEHQLAIAKSGGLPPVREDLYDSPEIDEIYPGFGDVVRESIRDAASRPSESPAYQDLSLGIQRGLHPASGIDPESPGKAYDRLKEYVDQAVKREGLL
jgi:multiple sugar transport system substrate-binding protein